MFIATSQASDVPAILLTDRHPSDLISLRAFKSVPRQPAAWQHQHSTAVQAAATRARSAAAAAAGSSVAREGDLEAWLREDPLPWHPSEAASGTSAPAAADSAALHDADSVLFLVGPADHAALWTESPEEAAAAAERRRRSLGGSASTSGSTSR